MKIHKQCIAIVTIGTLSAVCLVNSGRADESAGANPGIFYRAQEVSVDLFGTGSINQQTFNHFSGDRVQQNGRLGAGAGLNYFFTRFIGLSGEAYTENTERNFIDSASLNLVGRLPLGESGVAPYIFGGGGHQFDNVDQNIANAGAGIEFRFHHNWGIFIDGRCVFAKKTDDYGMARAGLRFSF
jgi:hypothetical protein